MTTTRTPNAQAADKYRKKVFARYCVERDGGEILTESAIIARFPDGLKVWSLIDESWTPLAVGAPAPVADTPRTRTGILSFPDPVHSYDDDTPALIE